MPETNAIQAAYERFKLEWMLAHGYTLKNLIDELEQLRKESPERTRTEWKRNEAPKRENIYQNEEIRCKKPSVTGSAGRSMKYILPVVGRNRSMTKWCGSFARKPLPHLLTKRTNRSIIKTATCLSGVHYRRNEP